MESVLSDISDLSDTSRRSNHAAERVLATLRKKDTLIVEQQNEILRLESLVASLMAERAVVLEDKTAIVESLKEATTTLEERERDVMLLREKVDQLTEATKSNDAAELKRWKEMHAIVEQRCALLVEEVSDVNQTLSKVTHHIHDTTKELEETKQHRQQDLFKYEQELEKLKNDLTTQRTHYKAQMDALRKDYEGRGSEITALTTQLSQATKEKEYLESECQRLKGLYAEMISTQETSRSELRTLRNELIALRDNANRLNEKLSSSEKDRLLLVNERDTLQQSLKASDHRYAVVQRTCVELKDSLESISHKHTSSCTEVTEVHRQISELKQMYDNECEKNEQSLDALKQCEGTILKLEEEAAHRLAVQQQRETTYQETITAIEAKMETYTNQLKDASHHREVLQARIRELENTVDKMKHTIEDLEDVKQTNAIEIEQLHRSLSACDTRHIAELHLQQKSHASLEEILDGKFRDVTLALHAERRSHDDTTRELSRVSHELDLKSIQLQQATDKLKEVTAHGDSLMSKLEAVLNEYETAKVLWNQNRAQWNVDKENAQTLSQEYARIKREHEELQSTLCAVKKEEKRLRDQIQTLVESGRRRQSQESEATTLNTQLSSEIQQLREDAKTKNYLIRQLREDIKRTKELKDSVEEKYQAVQEELSQTVNKYKRVLDDRAREKALQERPPQCKNEMMKKEYDPSLDMATMERKIVSLEAKLSRKTGEVERLQAASASRAQIVQEHLDRVVIHVVNGAKTAAKIRMSRRPTATPPITSSHTDMDAFLMAAAHDRDTFREASNMSKELLGVDMSDLLTTPQQQQRPGVVPPQQHIAVPLSGSVSEKFHSNDYYLHLLHCALSGDTTTSAADGKPTQVSLSHFLLGIIDRRVRLAEMS